MRRVCTAIIFWALAARLPAATIDVSLQTTQVLHSGDSLVFLFTDGNNFAGLPPTLAPEPSQIFFDFISIAANTEGQFTAEVESADESAAVLFPGPLWIAGQVQTADFAGTATFLLGELELTSAQSREIFASSQARLVLGYTGPDVTVGLPGYALQSDLNLSMNYGFAEEAGYGAAGGLDPPSGAPEPRPEALSIATGLLLVGLSLARKRFRGPW